MGVNRPALSIGRIVHYVETNAEHSPALVTRVWGNGAANITVFTDQKLPKTLVSVALDETDFIAGTIHWPERVEPEKVPEKD